MLSRLVASYFTVLPWYPVMLIAEDTCGRWLGLCWYDNIDIGLAPLVLPRQTSWQTEAVTGKTFGLPICLSWLTFVLWTRIVQLSLR